MRFFMFVVNSDQPVHHCVHVYASRVTCKSVWVSKLLHSVLALDGCEESYASLASEIPNCVLVVVRVAIVFAIKIKVQRQRLLILLRAFVRRIHISYVWLVGDNGRGNRISRQRSILISPVGPTVTMSSIRMRGIWMLPGLCKVKKQKGSYISGGDRVRAAHAIASDKILGGKSMMTSIKHAVSILQFHSTYELYNSHSTVCKV